MTNKFKWPYEIMEDLAVQRFQKYLDTGIHDSKTYSKTWDMLAWLDSKNKLNQ